MLTCHRPKARFVLHQQNSWMAASQTPGESLSHLHSRSGRASGNLLLVQASWLQLLDVPRAPLGGSAGNEAIMEGQRRYRRKGHSRASLATVLGWGHGPLGPVISEVTAQKCYLGPSLKGGQWGCWTSHHLCRAASAFDQSGSHGHVWKQHTRLN